MKRLSIYSLKNKSNFPDLLCWYIPSSEKYNRYVRVHENLFFLYLFVTSDGKIMGGEGGALKMIVLICSIFVLGFPGAT